jgi:hypothetical protein
LIAIASVTSITSIATFSTVITDAEEIDVEQGENLHRSLSNRQLSRPFDSKGEFCRSEKSSLSRTIGVDLGGLV